MHINNRYAILIVSLLMGAAVSICCIGSQAYLLSTTEPLHALYTEVVAGILFAITVRRIPMHAVKFSAIAITILVAYIAVLLSLALPFYPPLVRAIAWVLIASIGVALFRWIITELTARHLNPAIAQNYFYYTIILFELGVLTAVTFLKFHPLAATEIIIAAGTLISLVTFVITAQFNVKKNIEILLPSKGDVDTEPSNKAFTAFFIWFAIMLLCMGAFKISEDYLIKFSLKTYLGSYDAIRNAMAEYFFIASILVLAVSLSTGKLIHQRHVSPVMLIMLHTVIIIAAGIYCLLMFSLQSVIIFEIVRRVSDRCFYAPAEHMIRGAFVGKYRRTLHSAQSLYYFAFAAIPLVLLFTYIQSNSVADQISVFLFLVLFFACAGILTVWMLKKRLITVMYAFISSGNVAIAVPAIQTLSYIRPQGYSKKISDVLHQYPDKILHKTAIIGLSYVRKESSDSIIMEEFKTSQEDVQISVLEALSLAGRHRSIQFIINVLISQISSASTRVRMNAAVIIAGIYGSRAIPFLLNGVESKDSRVIADTLEVLTVFKDASLIPVFHRFVDSPIGRIRANALMGLATFRKTRHVYRAKVKSILVNLADGNTDLLTSILFIIGKYHDTHFDKGLEVIYHSELKEIPDIKRCLAWALVHKKDQKGYALFAELFEEAARELATVNKQHTNATNTEVTTLTVVQESLMRFFSQLNKPDRFQLIEYLAEKHRLNNDLLSRFLDLLRCSPFDLYEETQYLCVLKASVGYDANLV